MQFSQIKRRLNDIGLCYDGHMSPSKAICNNCDAVITYDIPKHPHALLLTLTDSMGGEVFYCPNCGPIDEDSLDGVTIE